MLKTLYIRSFALIDEIEIAFEPGLNVITGETGAGKSIIIGALKLLLGARSSTELVRTGETKAVVEGIFDVSGRTDILERLHALDLEASALVVIRRELTRDMSRAFLNDSPVRLDVLRSLASTLIDLHGQHDHQSILRPETHLPLLDGLISDLTAAETYRAIFEELNSLEEERADTVRRLDELTRDRELAEFQLAEIDAVAPQADEETALHEELMLLDNVERLVEGTQGAFEILYGSDASLYDQLSATIRRLEDLQVFDARLTPFVEDLKAGTAGISDVAAFLRDYAPSIDFDPARAEEVRERIGAFELLKRKYGGSIEAVVQFRESLADKLGAALSSDEHVAELGKRINELRPRLSAAASDLSSVRAETARALQSAISAELGSLAMADARFEARLDSVPDPDGWVTNSQGASFKALASGMDVCEFYLSANRGEPPKALAKVASGGEASRIMLALKSVLARADQVSTLVFDEIDTGISGAVAGRVGESMRRLAEEHQVITITHLPQIAAAAQTHFVVLKQSDEERTTTRIRRLDADERAREIASLLSGAEISSAALESARELIMR